MPKQSTVKLTKRAVDAAKPGSFVWDGECRGFGLRVTPAGSKGFLFRYRADGRQQYERLGSYPGLTVEKARAKAEDLRGARNTNHRAVRETAEDERRKAKTVADLEGHYLGEYAKARGLRPTTLRDARGVLRLVNDPVKRIKVKEVTIPDIRRLHGEARDAAGVYQANRLLAVLSKMFSLAIEEGWRTGDNPCRGVKKFPEDQRWRTLADAEVARLLDACEDYVGQDPVAGQNAANAVRLLLFTGARLQEALKAEWAEFDLEAGLWNKPSAHTKTKRQHRLELDGPALELLRAMRQANPGGRFLFPGEAVTDEYGRTVERARADLKRPWKWIARKAGLDGVRLHDLRRTTASFMLSGGASLATVGKALGHTQAATTARYAHLSQSVQREELKRAGERMAALKGSAPKAVVVTLRSLGA
jgi:integrase